MSKNPPPAVVTEVAQAATDPTTGQVTLGFVPKVLKQVSTNLIKLRAGSSIYFKVTAPMKEAAKATRTDGKDADKNPPTLLDGVDLASGEVGTIICGSVLIDLFNSEYPSDSYVNKGFWIRVVEKKDAQAGGGRSYNVYDVKEIAV